MKNYEQIETNIEDKALIINLSRPEKLNAFTEVMMREIIDAVNLAEENNNIRAIIFTGKGEKYCAGADLSTGEDSFNWTDKKKEAKDIVRDAGGVLTLRLFKSTKPIIGAINGDAVGIGATMCYQWMSGLQATMHDLVLCLLNVELFLKQHLVGFYRD